MEKRKVLVIGLDGATWDLIKPWADEGILPTFKKLMDEGAWGELESLDVPISSASWTTITSGKNPGKHGIYDFSCRKENSYDIQPLISSDIKSEQIWDILGKFCKKVAVLNVPMTYPPKKNNGVMISGFPCPEENNNYTYPQSFLGELKEKIDMDIHFQPRISPHEEEKFLEEMFKITDYLKSTLLYLLKEKDFDFIMAVFVGPDALGHTFFKYIDKNHPQYEFNEKLSKGLLEMYIELDKSLESIKKELNEDTKVFLVSDHGFSSVYYGVALNKWLMEREYLSLKKTVPTQLKKYMFNLGLTYENIFKIVKTLKLVKKSQNEAYSKESLLKRISSLVMITWNDIDWSKTKAYSQGNFGQIFINLRGREPEGIIEDREYNELVNQIINDLENLRHNEERVFDLIKRGKDAYRGEFAKNAPDIICTHSASKYIVSRFFEFGSKNVIYPHPVWSGTHDKRGIFLAWDGGKDIGKNERVTAKVEDITPTILHLYGIGLPEDMDGRIIKDIFKKNSELIRQDIPHQKPSLKKRIKLNIGRLVETGKI